MNDPMFIAAVVVMAVIFLLCVRNVLGRKTKGTARARDPLDKPLWSAGGVTILTTRTLNQGVLVTGQTGSGKSSGVIHNLLRAVMRAGYGMCLIAPKPGDATGYLKLAGECGRDDVTVLDRGCKNRLAFFETLLRVDESPATLAALGQSGLEVISEVITRKDGHSGEDSTFWAGSFQNHARCLIGAHVMARVLPTPKGLMALQNSIPRTPKEVKSEEFKDSYCRRLLEKAQANARAEGWMPDLATYEDYVLNTLPRLGEKTRGVVEMMLSNALAPMLSGIGAQVLAGEPNFDLGKLVSGNGVLVCDFPLAQYQSVGSAIGACVKYLCQLEVMRRNGGKPFVFVIDEAANYLSTFDYEYVSISRSFQGPMVICLQGVEQLAKGDDFTRADSLSGNCATKIACLPTHRTAEWLSKLIGKHRDFFSGGSVTGGYDAPFAYGSSTATGSFNEQLTEIIRPEELYTLRTGGAGKLVDALLIQSGRGHEFITLQQG